MNSLYGMSVVVSSYICESPTFVRWKRTHRKKRIAKKWHKRYGAVMSVCKGQAYQITNTLVMCPCYKAKFDEAMLAGGKA